MLRHKCHQISLLLLSIALLSSCRSKPKADISTIDLDIRIERFDRSLDSLSPATISTKAPELKQRYGAFYDDYMNSMLAVGLTTDTAYYTNLREVLINRDYLELKAAVSQTFPSLEKHEEELTNAFRHIKYYYPEQKIPRLISFFSGFAVQVPIGDNYIGIGLDMFLGKDSKFYPALQESMPRYISRGFTPENITPRIVEYFIREEMFPESDSSKRLLDKMIYYGKILYATQAMIPDTPDSLIIGYTNQQVQWCREFESDIWGYFLENDLLFNSNYQEIQKYLAEAPFTPGLGEKQDSAPKLGIWTGWQIVKKYMDKNTDITLQQLMQDNDAQRILNLSKYKPK